MDMHTELIFRKLQTSSSIASVKSLMKRGYYPMKCFAEIDLADESTSFNEDDFRKFFAEKVTIPLERYNKKFLGFDRIPAYEDYGTSLIYAVKMRLPLSTVRALIRTGVDINATNKYRESAMSIAIRDDNVQATKLLIACGAKINRGSSRQPLTSALHQAIADVSCDVVEYLLKSGVNVNDLSEKGETPLCSAVRLGSIAIVELLLKAGAHVDLKDRSGTTALYIAMRHHFWKIAETLLCAGANPNELCRSGKKSSETPFAVAVVTNTEIEMLLKFGADPCVKIGHGYPVWHKAIYNNNCRSLEVLLQHPQVRLNLNQKCSKGLTAVHYAAMLHYDLVLCQLLRVGAAVDIMDNHQCTPLFYAASHMKYSFVSKNDRWLNELREDFNWNTRGADCTDVLIYFGADINITNSDGHVALDVVADGSYKDGVSSRLIRYIAELESCNRPVNKRYTTLINNVHELQEKYNKCNAELNVMKEKLIGSGVTFWHFLVDSSTTVDRYFKNTQVREAFKKIPYREIFPIYGEKLESRFEEIKERSKTLSGASQSLIDLTGFNESITDNILRFLSVRDLENLASISKQ